MLRRIYIDSRYRSSGTDSDFTYDLPVSLEIPDNTIGFVDSVFFPNVFTSIHDLNNRLYLIEVDSTNAQEKIILLQPGNYTGQELASLLQSSLNANTIYSVGYDETKGKLTISNPTTTWLIPTRKELMEAGGTWASSAIPENDFRTCYDVIGFADDPTQYQNGVFTGENFVDLVPYETLFLCSSTIGNLGQSVGPVGQSDIVRRIVVNAPFGNNVHEVHSTNAHYVDCSNTTLSQMRWRLTDAVGRTVDLSGHGISFSVCFLDKAVV